MIKRTKQPELESIDIVAEFAGRAKEMLQDAEMDASDLDAVWNLSIVLANGNEEVEQDELTAFALACYTAEQGLSQAQNQIGYCFAKGLVAACNKKEAVKWYRKAAEQDNELAWYNLGDCYLQGDGVEMDLLEAEQWYRRAEEKGIEAARPRIDYIENAKPGLVDGVPRETLFVDDLLDQAERLRWFRSRNMMFYIPEMESVQDQVTDHLTDFLFEQLQGNEENVPGFTYLIAKYLFAKSVESTIAWGHSEDGRYVVSYHPKHLIENEYELEIPVELHDRVEEAAAQVEQVFEVYNEFMGQQSQELGRMNLYASSRTLFKWIQLLGVNYALERDYDELWK